MGWRQEWLVDGDAMPRELLWLSRAVVLVIGATAGGAGERVSMC